MISFLYQSLSYHSSAAAHLSIICSVKLRLELWISPVCFTSELTAGLCQQEALRRPKDGRRKRGFVSLVFLMCFLFASCEHFPDNASFLTVAVLSYCCGWMLFTVGPTLADPAPSDSPQLARTSSSETWVSAPPAPSCDFRDSSTGHGHRLWGWLLAPGAPGCCW